MGFTRDNLALVIPLADMDTSGGTWTRTRAAGPIWTVNKTAAGDTTYVRIPLLPPMQSAKVLNGAKVKSIDIWWTNGTADLTSLTPTINRVALPADAVAMGAPTALTFAYDAGHDTAAERVTQAAHKMTLTLSAPTFINEGTFLFVELTIVAAAGSVFKLHEARANFELNI